MANANVTEMISNLRKNLASFGMDEAQIEKMVAEAVSKMQEPARRKVTEALLKAATKVTETNGFKEVLPLLHGATISVYITVDENGELTIGEKLVTVRKSGGTSGKSGGTGTTEGKRSTKILPDGRTFGTWAEVCRAFNLDINGDSAKRVYMRAHETDPVKYPKVDEVDSTEGGNDENPPAEAPAPETNPPAAPAEEKK